MTDLQQEILDYLAAHGETEHGDLVDVMRPALTYNSPVFGVVISKYCQSVQVGQYNIDEIIEDMFDKVLTYAHQEGRFEVRGDSEGAADYGLKEYIKWENWRIHNDAPIIRKHVVKELERKWTT